SGSISLTTAAGANDILVNALVKDGSGGIIVSAGRAITEGGTGAGVFKTTGTLKTTSAGGTGTQLGNANVVSAFNATDSSATGVSLTNAPTPAALLTVTGISETGTG